MEAPSPKSHSPHTPGKPGHLKRYLPIHLWLLLVAAAAAVVMRAPPLRTDLAQFLPTSVDPQQRLLVQQLREGPGAGLLLLEIGGGDRRALVAASRALARTLKAGGHFRQVLNGTEALDPAAIRGLLDYRYLLLPGAGELLRPPTLRHELQTRLQELSGALGLPDKRYLPADPVAAVRRLAARWTGSPGPRQGAGVWLSRDGTRALLMLSSRHPAFDLERQAEALAAIRDGFAALPGAAGLTLGIAGPPLFAVQSRDLIRDTAQRLSWLASLGVALILLVSLRSPRLVVLAALPLASGVLAGAAVTSLLFGQLHGIALTFGITLIGIAVDYPIHLFAHAAGRGVTPRVLREVWPIMRLGLITTCLGFSVLLFSDFGGLSQLGAFAVAGLLAAAGVTRFVLPLLAGGGGRDSWGPSLAARLRPRRLGWLPPLLAGLAAMLLVARGEALWEHDLARLSPVPPEARTLDRVLRDELGAPEVGRLLLLTGSDAEQVLRRSEGLEDDLQTLRRDGALADFDLPSRYLPSRHTQRQRRAALPDRETLSRDLAEALRGLPFKAGLFEPFLEAVARSRELPPLTPEKLADTPLGTRLEMLLGHRGEAWVGLATLTGIRDLGALQRLAAAHPGVTFVDLARDSSRLVADYRDEALHLALWGGAIIVLVLGLTLRRASLVWRVLSPLLAAVLGSAALLALAGQQLSLFHLAALLLVLGIGTDYALFVALTPRDSPRFTATVGSLAVCGLSTLLVFGLLALSGVPVLTAIGLTVFTGTGISLVLSGALVQNAEPSDRPGTPVRHGFSSNTGA